MTEKELKSMIGTVASDRRHGRTASDITREVGPRVDRRRRHTWQLRTAAYCCALLLVGLVTSAALPAHRYDYVLGTHADHPEVAYCNTLAILQAL